MSTADSRKSPPQPRPRRHCADILLCPEWDILAMVSALSRGRPAGVLCAAGLPDSQFQTLRAALLRPRSARRPLHPLLAPTVLIERLQVSTYQGKDQTVAALSEWATRQGLSARMLAGLEQAVDELLLNALFDAPCDASGRPRYVALTPQQRLAVQAPPNEQAEVRYAADAHRVVVAVRDPFGGLRRSTIVNYLVRCATAQNKRQSPLERKGGGAGVGLYLVLGAASELIFRLRRGHSTEVVYTVYRERPRPLRALIIDDAEP